MSKAELIPFIGAIKAIQKSNLVEKQAEQGKGVSKNVVLAAGALSLASLACTKTIITQYLDPKTIYNTDDQESGESDTSLPTSNPYNEDVPSIVTQEAVSNKPKISSKSAMTKTDSPEPIEEIACFPQPDERKTFRLGDKYIVGQREGFSDNVDFTDSWGAPIGKVGVSAEQVGDQGDPCYKLTLREQILIVTAELGRRFRTALKLENIDSGSVNPREALID